MTPTFLFLQIVFDNRAHSGKIKVDVENDVRINDCQDWNVEGTCKFLLEFNDQLMHEPNKQ